MIAFFDSINLKTRVLLLVALLLIAGIWSIAARSTTVLKEDIENLLAGQMTATVTYVAADIDKKLRQRILLLTEVAAAITPEMLANPVSLRRYLEQRNVSATLFPFGLFVANRTGTMIADYPTTSGRVGNTIANLEYFHAVMTGDRPVIGKPFMGRFSNRVTVPMAVPLHDASGHLIGTLVGPMFPGDENLFGQLEEAKMGRTGNFLVISPKDRIVVAATDKTRIMQTLPSKGVNALGDRRIEEGFEGVGVTTNSRGLEVLSVSRNIPSLGWYVAANVASEEAFAPITMIKRQIYLAALFMTVVVIVILRFVLTRQLAPLEEAGQRMRNMTAGAEPLSPLPVVRNDEIGRMVHSFNQLATDRIRLDESLRAEVVERRLAEISLKRLNDKTQAFLRNASDGVHILDANGNVLECSDSFCSMLGYARNELIGANVSLWDARWTPQELKQVLAAQVVKGGHAVFETKHRHRDGIVFDVEISSQPLELEGEKVLFNSARDITERKLAEEARNRLAAIVENSNDAIFSRALDGTILSWNAGAERMIGYTAAEIIGKPVSVTLPANRRPNLEKNNEALLRGEVVVRETDRLTKDGRVVDVLSSHSPIRDANGQIVGASVIMQNITERKQTEQKLRESEVQYHLLVKAMNEGVVLQGANSEIITANESAERILGLTLDQMTGKSSFSPEWRPIHEDGSLFPGEMHPVPIALRTGLPQSDVIMGIHKPDGTLTWISINVQPIFKNGDTKPYRAVATMRDITARKEYEVVRDSLEAQLRESQKMEAIGTLAGGIAHDFNNIVATILGNAELAFQDAETNPRATQQSIEEIRKAGRRARDLVAQILSFSRRQPTARKAIGLAPIIDESVRLLRATIPPRISIAGYCDADSPLVLADATQIQQILINLATNAMQAMRANGRIEIRLDTVMLGHALANTHPQLRVMHDRHPGRTVRVSISDTASGMDAATLGKIFEPFFTTKPVGEGTGLGLSVVYGIVQTHEGAITVESTLGKGTTFTIYLPIVQGPIAVPAVESATTATSKQVSGVRVLYLDDDEALVYLVKRLLERRGYRVSDFTDQKAAIAALRANPAAFDFVLTDYNMPGISGLDVAREVKAIRVDLPVAVTSGFIDEELRAQAAGAGVRELIFKADAVDVLCEAVQRVVQEIKEMPS